MGGKMTRAAFEQMVAENVTWLEAQPRTLERDHVIGIVKMSPRYYYEDAQQAAHEGEFIAQRERNREAEDALRARIAALEAERDGYCSIATQAGREAAALRTERAELRRRLDEREGAEDRADEAMYALRAARADLEYEKNTAATLRECWQDLKDRLDAAKEALRAVGRAGGTQANFAYAALDEIDTAEFARPAPVSAAPTGLVPQSEAWWRWVRASTCFEVGLSKCVCERGCNRATCGNCGGDVDSNPLKCEDECHAPPAPEVPTVEAPHVHVWVTAHGDHHATCTSPDVRRCGWVAAKVCACGEALCSKHFACSPVALETHGLSHGDACPAGKEPR